MSDRMPVWQGAQQVSRGRGLRASYGEIGGRSVRRAPTLSDDAQRAGVHGFSLAAML